MGINVVGRKMTHGVLRQALGKLMNSITSASRPDLGEDSGPAVAAGEGLEVAAEATSIGSRLRAVGSVLNRARTVSANAMHVVYAARTITAAQSLASAVPSASNILHGKSAVISTDGLNVALNALHVGGANRAIRAVGWAEGLRQGVYDWEGMANTLRVGRQAAGITGFGAGSILRRANKLPMGDLSTSLEDDLINRTSSPLFKLKLGLFNLRQSVLHQGSREKVTVEDIRNLIRQSDVRLHSSSRYTSNVNVVGSHTNAGELVTPIKGNSRFVYGGLPLSRNPVFGPLVNFGRRGIYDHELLHYAQFHAEPLLESNIINNTLSKGAALRYELYPTIVGSPQYPIAVVGTAVGINRGVEWWLHRND